MNRNHLALFHAVAQAGGISHGAKKLHVSQPAVSKQIAELESSLGVQLLDRLPRGCRLTDAGQILADHARRFAALESEAERAIEEYRGLKQGRLSVGASTTIGAYLLPPVFAEVHRRFPDLELRLEIANTQMIQRLLVEGAIEIGLTEGVIEVENLESEVFHQDELVAIAPPGHPLLGKRRVTLRELCCEPFVMREEGSGTRAVIERAIRKKGLTVKSVLSLASTEAIKHVVAAGIGIAIVSRLALDLELQSGSLAIIPVTDLALRRPLHLQKILGKNLGPAATIFLNLLSSTKTERR